MLSHVARILTGEVHRETKSVWNISRSINYHERKQAEWMCNIPRSLSDNEAKQAIYNEPLCVSNISRSALILDEQRNKRDKWVI